MDNPLVDIKIPNDACASIENILDAIHQRDDIWRILYAEFGWTKDEIKSFVKDVGELIHKQRISQVIQKGKFK